MSSHQTETCHALLDLDSNLPQKVYVRYCGKDPAGKNLVGFALKHGGVYHLEGLHWKNRYVPDEPMHGDDKATRPDRADSGYVSKFINFVLELPVYAIECDLHYSPSFDASDSAGMNLLMCIPHGEFQAEYHFEVYAKLPPDGNDASTVTIGGVQVRKVGIDPKIVVSPTTDPTMVTR